MMTSNSPAAICSDTSSSARTPLGYVLETRSRTSIGLSSAARKGIFPTQEGRSSAGDDPIRELAQERERDDGSDDLGRFAELLAIGEEKAKTLRRAHELCGHHEHPTKS